MSFQGAVWGFRVQLSRTENGARWMSCEPAICAWTAVTLRTGRSGCHAKGQKAESLPVVDVIFQMEVKIA